MNKETAYFVFFIIGATMMTLGVSYAWWLKLRVIWLRQDIYDLRDGLFMESVRLGCVDDAGSQAARNHLNTLAQIAPVISIWLVLNALKLGLGEAQELPKSDNSKLSRIIAETMQRADRRIGHYLLRHTLTGLVLISASRLIPMSWIKRTVNEWVEEWRRSRAAEDTFRLIRAA